MAMTKWVTGKVTINTTPPGVATEIEASDADKLVAQGLAEITSAPAPASKDARKKGDDSFD